MDGISDVFQMLISQQILPEPHQSIFPLLEKAVMCPQSRTTEDYREQTILLPSRSFKCHQKVYQEMLLFMLIIRSSVRVELN